MLEFFRKRMKDDRGFTLIELMVVVLIIAILIAIAIPTFLGLRQRAQNRAAQSDLRNGLTAAKAFYTDAETYTGFNVAQGDAIEPSLNWSVAAGSSLNTVHIAVPAAGGGQEIVLNTTSESSTVYCISDSSTQGTVRGTGVATDHADCANNTPNW